MAKVAPLHWKWPPTTLWMDASVDDTLSYAAISDRVNYWKSKTSYTLEFSATGDARPTYVASAINSKPAIQFDESLDQVLTLSSAVFSGSLITAVVVMQSDAGDTTQHLALTQSNDTQDDRFWGLGRWISANDYVPIMNTQDDEGTVRDFRGSTEVTRDAAHIITTVVSTAFSDAAKNGTMYLDGIEETVSSGNGAHAPGDITAASNTSIGAVLKNSGVESCMDGYIAEIMAWDNIVLSSRELYNVTQYLGTKYNISV